MHWARIRPGTAPHSEAAFSDGVAVVGLAAPDQADAVARDYGVQFLRLNRRLRVMEVTGMPEQLRALAGADLDRRLRYVEPPARLTFMHMRNDPRLNLVDPVTNLPYEWTFARLGVDRALNLGRGSPTILVGVVDTGVSPVPDLSGKVVQTFFSPKEDNADDLYGHGTFVSSIIAATNDDGFGLAGFCGACRLVVYKIGPDDDYLTITTAVEQLVDSHVRVINLSLGGNPGDTAFALTDAIEYATSHGVLVVAAAGNEGAGDISYPAAQLQPENGEPGNGLAVGASDASGNRAPFSNYGTRLSLLAPGSFSGNECLGVFGAIPLTLSLFELFACAEVRDSITGALYVYAEGTSFSTPEVAGIAALVWSAAPSATSPEIVRVLEQTATRPAGSGWSPDTGWGIVNAARAMEAVTSKSSADRMVVGRPAPTRAARSGELFQLSANAHWSDGIPVPKGTARCSSIVAGKRIAVKGQVAEGLVECQWRVPKLRKVQAMRGRVTVTDNAGVTGFSQFAFRVTPAG
jgi:subtilisin family serine protease